MNTETKARPNTESKKRRARRGEAQSEYARLISLPPTENCIIWKFSCYADGYGAIGRDGKMTRVHRQLAIDLLGDPPTSDHQAAHSCGNGHLACVNPHHLRWATAKENSLDRVLHGTDNRGAKHNLVRLAEADVIDIFKSNETQVSLASRYGVSKAHVCRIKNGKKWSWLTSTIAI